MYATYIYDVIRSRCYYIVRLSRGTAATAASQPAELLFQERCCSWWWCCERCVRLCKKHTLCSARAQRNARARLTAFSGSGSPAAALGARVRARLPGGLSRPQTSSCVYSTGINANNKYDCELSVCAICTKNPRRTGLTGMGFIIRL